MDGWLERLLEFVVYIICGVFYLVINVEFFECFVNSNCKGWINIVKNYIVLFCC